MTVGRCASWRDWNSEVLKYITPSACWTANDTTCRTSFLFPVATDYNDYRLVFDEIASTWCWIYINADKIWITKNTDLWIGHISIGIHAYLTSSQIESCHFNQWLPGLLPLITMTADSFVQCQPLFTTLGVAGTVLPVWSGQIPGLFRICGAFKRSC